MRIIAIDASPINGGPASYAVDVSASAAEESGADVVRIRLYDLHAFCCTDCGSCTPTGRCTKRDGLLSHAERVMQGADVLILGAPARLQTSKHGALPMLRRLLGAYTGVSAARGWYNTASTFAEGKRAAIIAAGSSFGFPIGTFGMARAATKQLSDAHVHLVEVDGIPGSFSNASARDVTRERAEKLGTALAGPTRPNETSPGPRSRGRRQRTPGRLQTERAG